MTHQAVRKAIETGRLKRCLRPGRRGAHAIDPEIADQEWTANTDPAQVRARPGAPGEPAQGTLPGMTPPDEARTRAAAASGAAGQAFAAARAMSESARARLARLDLEEREGRLVELDRVVDGASTIGRELHDALRAMPARVAGTLYGMRSANEVRQLLDAEIDRILRTLSTRLEEIGASARDGTT